MKIGYIRVSTIEQNEERQVINLADMDKVYTDKASGKNTNRPALKEMLAFVREGDTVYVDSFSRIARNTVDLLGIVEQLTAKKVNLVSLKESFDTSTPQGRLMLTMFGALAQFEREQTLERQREGIAIAKADGRYHGKPKMQIDESELRHVCAKWRAGELTAVTAMKILNLKPNTFYRRVKELGL